MASRRSPGISGSAVALATAGLYLVYVGVKDVPFLDGLRSLLRKEAPTPRASHTRYMAMASNPSAASDDGSGSGELGLVGSAAAALPAWRSKYPGMTMYGRGDRPQTPESDHPIGKAIDLMTGDEKTAQDIIRLFKTQKGSKYWIWNRKKGDARLLWVVGPYTGPNPHTDHVHLSYF